MANTPKRGNELATIDCAMIVAIPEDGSDSIAITSGTKLGVEVQTETTDAVKLIIKNKLKAQKPEQKTITGHKLTLTDALTILELIEILQGGVLEKDENGKITRYTAPTSDDTNTGKKFALEAYSAQMEGADIIGYEKITYPGCQGSPVAFASEDDVFRVNEYEINSAPGAGEAPYTIEMVEELPEVAASTLGVLSVTSAAGTTTGNTKITVTPAKTPGNQYYYKTGASVPSPKPDESVSSYTEWDGTEEIQATNGQKILIVEADGEAKAKKAGTATVVAKS